MKLKYDMLTILGPTAGGKTSLATRMAYILKGEIISADSRQVYRGMDLGTGKDLGDYIVDGYSIPYHLIDIVDAGYKYNIYEYQQDFIQVYDDLNNRSVFPIFCGGSGMYLEAILKGYRLVNVPENSELRIDLEQKTTDELITILSSIKKLHNTSDIDSRKRLIRAIEIEKFNNESKEILQDFPPINSLIIGVKVDLVSRRKKITERLQQRIEEGMIDEVDQILKQGVSSETLIYYGLEYKFITQYLMGEMDYKQMFTKLETAIHQFAKRQMTWYRGMERKGFEIHWLDAYSPMQEKTEKVMSLLSE